MCEEVGQDTLKGSEGPVSLLSSFLIKMLHKKLFPLGMPPPSQKSPYDSILLISQSNSTATSCIKIEARAGRKSPFSNSLSTVPVPLLWKGAWSTLFIIFFLLDRMLEWVRVAMKEYYKQGRSGSFPQQRNRYRAKGVRKERRWLRVLWKTYSHGWNISSFELS